MRFARFLLVGGTAALVQFGLLAWLSRMWSAGLAFTAAFICSTATHYVLNRCWALPSVRRDQARQLLEYLGTAALSYGVNVGLFQLAHGVLGLGVMWAAVLALPPSTLLVFVLLNYRVFRREAQAR